MAAIREFAVCVDSHVSKMDVLNAVRERTKESIANSIGESYCEHLLRLRPSRSDVGPATVLISYMWSDDFHQFIAALEERFGQDESGDTFLWIDLFSINQHDDSISERWLSEFEQQILRINHTVLILSPPCDRIDINHLPPLKRLTLYV